MLDRGPITRAIELIQGSIELLEKEQLSFTTLRLRDDLREAIKELEAVQTVALPPHRPASVKLSGIDDGEPCAYDLGVHGTTIIIESEPGAFPHTHEVKFKGAKIDDRTNNDGG